MTEQSQCANTTLSSPLGDLRVRAGHDLKQTCDCRLRVGLLDGPANGCAGRPLNEEVST